MAQWLRALAVIAEDTGSVPSTPRWLTTSYSPRRPDIVFWPHFGVAHKPTKSHTCTYKIKESLSRSMNMIPQ